MFIENKPDEIELLSFFESEPVSFNRDNVSYLYTAKDEKGLCIDFSFSVAEGWIQYVIKLDVNECVRNAIDGVSSFSIKSDNSGEYLFAEVMTNGLITKVIIRIKPYISVSSVSLVR
ncbi:TPA: hypothetical protein SML50_001810 [Serratia fonticola]|uniref:hypothetical protein n=1 Tax=Serratia fonticola TaxID=47917 RepID=UPI0029EFE17D|nr:hypothetical protein [Serratia fonticola]